MHRLRLTSILVGIALLGCEAYDPPPELELAQGSDGARMLEDPLTLRFSEPIEAGTLSVSIWLEEELDDDLALEAGVQPSSPLVNACEATACPQTSECDGLSLCVDDEGLSATLTFGEAFAPHRGTPLLLVVNPGLADRAGHTRGTPTVYPFQFLPECSQLPKGNPVDISLNSGIVTLVSSLSEGNEEIRNLYPTLFLRLLVDMIADPDTGETWLLATAARLHEEVKAEDSTSAAPLDRSAILDNEGWSLFIKGSLTDCQDGTLWLETEPSTLSIMVLGAIPVILQDFQLTGTVAPGAGEQGRDRLWGGLSASDAAMELGDVSNFGAVAASFTGDGLLEGEAEAELPRLCSDDPCALLSDVGGDCQIPTPWTKPPVCP